MACPDCALSCIQQESLAAEALNELRCSARGVGSSVFTGRVWRAAPIRPVAKRIEKKGPAMASEGIGVKQEKMIEQVAATMALENMPLSRDCYENLRAMASGEKTREQITREITAKFKMRVLEDG